MQDRFKLRAWHKPTRKIFVVYCIHFDLDTLEGGETTPYDDPIKLEDCNLIQCTGFKDKNGKLIYEWDIILFTAEISRTQHFKKNFVVVWDDKLGYYALQTLNGDNAESISAFTSGKIEVIGNIYENPELLETKNANI